MAMSIAPAGVPAVEPQAVLPPAGQDLFQYLASVNPSGAPTSPSPGQLGGAMVDNLKGFVDRAQALKTRAQDLTSHTPRAQPATMVHHGAGDRPVTPQAISADPQAGRSPVDKNQIDKVIQSLGMMFDYSIETQMVVRGATQVSGAANTLLRGQ